MGDVVPSGIVLTPQQEKFAQAVASGKNQAEAFRVANKRAQKWKPETVWSEASKLMALPKVSTRVQEIQAAIAKRAEVNAAAENSSFEPGGCTVRKIVTTEELQHRFGGYFCQVLAGPFAERPGA